MKSSRFCLLVILLTLSLSACGFRPVYTATTDTGHNVYVRDSLAQIEIAPIPNKIGVDLRNNLIDKIYQAGSPASPVYRLDVTVKDLRVFETGIARDAATIREQLKLLVSAKLTNIETNEVIFNRDFSSLTNYNILSSEYTTIVAREDAQNRAVNQVGDDIVTRLTLYLSGS
jgi:LPS-assembly lipoprotein